MVGADIATPLRIAAGVVELKEEPVPSRRQRRTDPHLVGEGRSRSGLGRLLTPLATGAAALSLVAVTVATADVDATSASFTDSESVNGGLSTP